MQYETHTFDVFLSAFQNQKAPAVLAVFHDISVLQELNQRQAEFTGNAAHELATPLTSISGFAEILREDDFTSPDDSHHYADVIYRQAQRMTRLIQELLQLTRLETKRIRRRSLSRSSAEMSCCRQRRVPCRKSLGQASAAEADIFARAANNKGCAGSDGTGPAQPH